MRSFAPAVLVCLALASGVGGWLIATASGGSGGNPPAAAAPVAHPAAAQKPAVAPVPATIDNDAPARHARRTACLKVAKSKKLVGAQRSSYVKSCMGSS